MKELKQCSRCKEKLPATIEYFYKRNTAKDGLRNWCKNCCRKYNGERVYSLENHIKYKYDLTLDEWFDMIRNQDYKCLICEEIFEPNGKLRPCVDHDHETSKVRGILCSMCNTGLGYFKDSKEFLQKAIEYLM